MEHKQVVDQINLNEQNIAHALTKGITMMTIEQINNRLNELEKEQAFLYDQLWEIQQAANDYNNSALYAMNGDNSHA